MRRWLICLIDDFFWWRVQRRQRAYVLALEDWVGWARTTAPHFDKASGLDKPVGL